jgi:hypothetical protein
MLLFMTFPLGKGENSSKLHGGKRWNKSPGALQEPLMPFPFDATLKAIVQEHTPDYEAALGLTGRSRPLPT